MIAVRYFAILLVALALPPLAAAQDDDAWRIRHLVIENDDLFPLFAGGPSDRFYSQGARFVFGKRIFDAGVEPATLPAWARLAARRCSACSIYPTFSVGQEIYTPQLIESPDPQPGEHPWAAWLYGALGATVDTPGDSRHEFELQVGVTGDRAGGRQLQDFWHRKPAAGGRMEQPARQRCRRQRLLPLSQYLASLCR